MVQKTDMQQVLYQLEDFKGKLGSSEYTGGITLKDFNKPLIDLSLKGRVYPSELKEFFNIKEISRAEGSVDLNLKLVNCSLSKKNFSFNEFIDLKPESSMDFNSFTLGLQKNKILFSKVTGNLTIQNSIKAKNIQFNYKGQNIKIEGEFKNLVEWISGSNVKMSANCKCYF